ncbi:hypothetical protein DICSQDRAFT_172828 [Dichomitus squalens LYAD-421 SS1]|uniref:Voltage-dependent anion channel-domain-containing protein n=1 Tax=Dichomitus squalens (strain LYAD-421) TaxID=732165 RepID=R7SUI9_DICSQ|nr:uncharacterized protein DICSQDRAFT_172828 [Dichomitus squalens LYAD-421 SS1]EJF58632.1 hypothetical protein DICSQDRAFT_172828 [Dichomitus squalens LYAD-421 SS1]
MSIKSVDVGKTAASYHSRLSRCVRHFTPAWFTAIMGTGAIAVLWQNSPYVYRSTATETLVRIFFFFDLFLFGIFNIVTALRYAMFPEVWRSSMQHPTQTLFLATYPMGATTLISIAAGIHAEAGFGDRYFVYTLWALWWADVFVSLMCAFGIVHIMFTRQKHSLERITAVWLLPVVTLIVASSTGGVLAASLIEYSITATLATLVFATALVTMGLTLAFMMLSLYFLRLALYGVPRHAEVASVFIPLGPLGQGAYSILLLGSGYNSVLPLHSGTSTILRQQDIGRIINVMTLAISLVLWSMATLWLIYAVMAISDVLWHDRVPFKQAFWSLIFPNGVYANLTIQLYRVTDSPFFRVWGATYAIATLLVWSWVFTRTCMLVYTGGVFRAPYLDEADIHTAAIEKDASTWNAHKPITDLEAACVPGCPSLPVVVATNGHRESDRSTGPGEGIMDSEQSILVGVFETMETQVKAM